MKCGVGRIPLCSATAGSFSLIAWDSKWCWWMSCRWSFQGSFAGNAFFFSLHFGASDFPSKNPFKKCVKKFFFALASRSVLNLQFPMPLRVVLLCFCNSVSADRIVVAASLLLPACLLQLDLENRFGVAA